MILKSVLIKVMSKDRDKKETIKDYLDLVAILLKYSALLIFSMKLVERLGWLNEMTAMVLFGVVSVLASLHIIYKD